MPAMPIAASLPIVRGRLNASRCIKIATLMSLNPGLAGVLEIVLGPLLLVGIFTRQVAFVLSGLMAFAYFMVHQPRGFWTLANGGDSPILYCFLFLYIAAVGGGKWSVDALRGKA